MSVYSSVSVRVTLFVCLSVHLSASLFVIMSVYLCVCTYALRLPAMLLVIQLLYIMLVVSTVFGVVCDVDALF